MSFEKDFLELMPDTVTVKNRTSRDGYGTPTYESVGTKVRARVVEKQERRYRIDGTMLFINAVAYLRGDVDVDENDRVELPSGDTPPILDVTKYPDESGVHHTEVTFGRMGGSP